MRHPSSNLKHSVIPPVETIAHPPPGLEDALRIADTLEDTSPWVACFDGWQAAAIIRLQHEIIKDLTEKLDRVQGSMFLD